MQFNSMYIHHVSTDWHKKLTCRVKIFRMSEVQYSCGANIRDAYETKNNDHCIDLDINEFYTVLKPKTGKLIEVKIETYQWTVEMLKYHFDVNQVFVMSSNITFEVNKSGSFKILNFSSGDFEDTGSQFLGDFC